MNTYIRSAILIIFCLIPFLVVVPISATSPWTRIIDTGFGDQNNWYVMNMTVFNNSLYVGTYNKGGCEIWETKDGVEWKQSNMNGFGDLSNKGIYSAAVFDNQIYVGTDSETGCEIWRSRDGYGWERSNIKGFGSSRNLAVLSMYSFNRYLYAAVYNNSGFELYRIDTGRSWKQVANSGFGVTARKSVDAMVEFQGNLYLGVRNLGAGAEVFRSADGVKWDLTAQSGFGDPDNYTVSAFAVFENKLFAGTFNKVTGAKIWVSDNGIQWKQVNSDGFGNIYNQGIHSLYNDGKYLYATIRNAQQGGEIWRSSNGYSWIQMDANGFGDANNFGITSLLTFKGLFYTGTYNWGGCQLWRIEESKQETRQPLPSIKQPSLFAQIPDTPTPLPTFTPYPTATAYPTYTPFPTYTPPAFQSQTSYIQAEPTKKSEESVFPVTSDDTYSKWLQAQKEIYQITPTPYSSMKEPEKIEEKPEESVVSRDSTMISETILYVHDSFYDDKSKEWDDQWSNSKVFPPGEFMDFYPPTSSVPSKTLLSILKTLYCYLDPPVELQISPGTFILTIWVGNPTGRVDIEVEAELSIVEPNGKKPVLIATDTRKCKTFSQGPAPFDIQLISRENLSLRNQRFRISINLIDSQQDLPYLYWESPNTGLMQLIVPASFQSGSKQNSSSRILTPETKILKE
ncbi:MAG: hypothetical protein A2161_10100 [Candidatus Schekmanbacteria bacterium RBG_13_48_7]|uniref:Uncharacterized protein n=1 Tax=Candidatus Schekmanbacteria bacterium RBG_13_48_7 TaxID=1817878 RepID=A0A1F7RWX9_9BACT|nr:MAG: hypothetical protein A2161_10100 [Candidatus Schekmanbacteria bacterium RBG_13_48_7]